MAADITRQGACTFGSLRLSADCSQLEADCSIPEREDSAEAPVGSSAQLTALQSKEPLSAVESAFALARQRFPPLRLMSVESIRMGLAN